eukprot:3514015-Pyramimonas_sp.AAC.2
MDPAGLSATCRAAETGRCARCRRFSPRHPRLDPRPPPYPSIHLLCPRFHPRVLESTSSPPPGVVAVTPRQPGEAARPAAAYWSNP